VCNSQAPLLQISGHSSVVASYTIAENIPKIFNVRAATVLNDIAEVKYHSIYVLGVGIHNYMYCTYSCSGEDPRLQKFIQQCTSTYHLGKDYR